MSKTRIGEIIRLYWEFDHYLFDWLDEQEDEKFSFSWYITLETLVRKGPSPLKEISKQLLITPASTSVMIKKMEAEDLVSKAADPNDGRVSLIHITDLGREKINSYYEFMEIFFTKHIPNDELQNYHQVLERAVEKLKETES